MGHITTLLAQKPWHPKVYALDIWGTRAQARNTRAHFEENIDYAGIRSQVHIIQENMVYFDGSLYEVDFIIAVLSVHNVQNSMDRDKALVNMVATLKPGGQILILDFKLIKQYKASLLKLGCKCQELKPCFKVFPPLFGIIATKP